MGRYHPENGREGKMTRKIPEQWIDAVLENRESMARLAESLPALTRMEKAPMVRGLQVRSDGRVYAWDNRPNP